MSPKCALRYFQSTVLLQAWDDTMCCRRLSLISESFSSMRSSDELNQHIYTEHCGSGYPCNFVRRRGVSACVRGVEVNVDHAWVKRFPVPNSAPREVDWR